MSCPATVEEMIRAARECGAHLGPLLEGYQPFLRLLAENQIHDKLRVRCDTSDLVQRTLLEATKSFQRFRGTTEPEFSAWLKRILAAQLADAVRAHLAAGKRSLHKERRICFGDDDSASISWYEPVATQTSPSMRVIRAERALRLAQLLAQLPPDQQEALRLRHMEGLRIDEIAERMQRTETAVGGLLKRGLKKLRDQMSDDSWR